MSLHHRLQNEEVLLNDTVGDNNKLIENINIMRKEILFAKDSIQNMQNQIEGLKGNAIKCNGKAISMGKAANETNN